MVTTTSRRLVANPPDNPVDADLVQPGCILWIRHYDEISTHNYQLEEKAHFHPCLVISTAKTNGLVSICVCTSKPPDWGPHRSRYVAISPAPALAIRKPTQLKLRTPKGKEVTLRKLTYVNTNHVHTVPLRILARYDRNLPADHFMLTKTSMNFVQQKVHMLYIPELQCQVDQLENTANAHISHTSVIEEPTSQQQHISSSHVAPLPNTPVPHHQIHTIPLHNTPISRHSIQAYRLPSSYQPPVSTQYDPVQPLIQPTQTRTRCFTAAATRVIAVIILLSLIATLLLFLRG